MTVIIRLQNLPWTANALDIRRYFQGLAIPDGGVHIVGGDKGDAFIAFGTDEDARKAMMMDAGQVGHSTVKLMLSSKTEMQTVIAVARGVPPSGQGVGAESFGRPDQHQGGPGGPQAMPPQSGQPNQGGSFNERGMGQGDRFAPGSGEQQGGGQGFQGPGNRGGPISRGGVDSIGPGVSNRMGGSAARGWGTDQKMGRPIGLGGPDQHMGMGGPDQRMGMGGPDQRVGMGGPDQRMGMGGPDQRVGMGGPDQRMGMGGPDQRMGMGGPDQRMGMGGPDQRMGMGGPDQRMGMVGPDQRMGMGGPDQRMGMGGPDQRMGMGGPDQRMGGPDQRMGRGGPDQRMTMGGPDQRMGMGGPDQRMEMGGPDQRMGMGRPDQRMGMGGRDQPMGMGPPDQRIPLASPDSRLSVTVGGSDHGRMGTVMAMHNIPDPDQRMRGGPMNMGGPDHMGDDRMGGAMGRGPMGGLDQNSGGTMAAPLVGLEQRISARMASREMDRGVGPMGAGGMRGGDMMRNNEVMGGMAMRESLGGLDSRDRFRDGPALNFNSRDGMDNFQGRGNRDDMNMNKPHNDFQPGFILDNMPMGGGDMMSAGGMAFNRDGFNPDGGLIGRRDDMSMGFKPMNNMDVMGGGPRDRSPFRDNMMGRDDFRRDIGADLSREVRMDKGRHSASRNFRDVERGRDRDLRSGGRDVRRRESGSGDVYVYASNMPLTITYKEVRHFFRGCEIPRDGLKLINDRHGKRTGSVYIKFAWEQGALEATKQSGTQMGDKTVRVERVSEDEYLKATDSFIPPGVNVHSHRDSSQVRGRSRSPIHRRHNDDSSETKFVIIKNAPFSVDKHMVKKLLGNLRPTPDGIIISHNPDGRPAGMVFVEFESRKDSAAALKLSREKMMGRSISVFPISQREFQERTRGEKGRSPGKSSRSKERDDQGSSTANNGTDLKSDDKQAKRSIRSSDPEKKYYCVKISGLPYSTTNTTVRDFFKDLEISNRGVHIVYDRNNQALSTGFVEFVTSTDCKKALDKDKQFIGKRYIEVEPITKKDMLLEFGELQSRYSSGGGSRGGGGGMSSVRASPRGGPSQSSGSRVAQCVVRLTNLSMDAEIADVINFFRAFHPMPDSVRFHFNNMGQRTGEGLVGFESGQNAQRAIRELNLKKLMGRPLCLHLD